MLTSKNVSWKIRNNILKMKILKNIEPNQNFTGFFKKGVEALNAYKKNIEPHQNFTVFF